MFKKLIAFVVAYLLSFYSFANGIDALNIFLKQQNFTAIFSQKVLMGKRVQITQGKLEISRPNKFRWYYNTDGQLILSDGAKVYIYDEPLKQVTVKKLSNTLGRSPAVLLSGGSSITSQYNVIDLKDKGDGLLWVQLTPKQVSDNNGFEKVLIAFDPKNNLNQMLFTDSFGNKSILTFNDLQYPKNFSKNNFVFSVPNGVDVLEE